MSGKISDHYSGKPTNDYNLDNIRYVVDANIIELFSMKRRSPRVREIMRDFQRKKLKYLKWDSILDIAAFFGVEPEYIIDERYYFGKYGYAPYKLIYTAWRKKGLTPAQFYLDFDKWFNSQFYKPSRMIPKPSFYRVIKRAKLEQQMGYNAYALFYLCRYLDIKISEVFMPTKSLGSDPMFVAMHDQLQLLNRVDAAVIAGIVRLFVLYPPGEKESEVLEKLAEIAGKRQVTTDEQSKGT